MDNAYTKNRIIMHIDMDAFFASVEQRDKPWLKGKPIAISNIPEERSVIATASYKARKFGVHSAMPVKIARKLCPELIIVKTDINKYRKESSKLLNIFNKFCPSVEQTSIDEVFLDLTYTVKNFNEAKNFAIKLKEFIHNNLCLPLTIGISYNKLLAKLASKIGKPNGLKIIKPEDVDTILEPLPIGKISGIGKQTEKTLKEIFNVYTLGELRKIPLLKLASVFHSQAVFLYNAARGIDNSKVIPEYEKGNPKSIGNSITLRTDTDNEKYIKSTLKYLSEEVGLRIRTYNLYAQTITIVVRYKDFSTFTHRKTLSKPIQGNFEIYIHALILLSEIWNRRKVRLLGISLSNLKNYVERGLFDTEDKLHTLENVIDNVKMRFGNEVADYGSVMLVKTKGMI